MSAGEWLVEMLASLSGRTDTPAGQDHPDVDVALWWFVREGIPWDLYDRLRGAHRRKVALL